MTSRISFSKLVRDEMRKLNWLTAVQILFFGMLIPFRVLMVLAVQRQNYLNGSGDSELLTMFYRNIGLGHWENTLFILMFGVICALCAFSYVHSSVKLDFFHSLPIKRERLFAAKYTGSVLTFVVGYGISQAAALVVGGFYGVLSVSVACEVAAATLEGILCFVCSYSGALLAVMLTGKMLTTILTIGVLGLYVPMIWLLQVVMRESFLMTEVVDGGAASHFTILECSSPWAFALFMQSGRLSEKMGLTGRWPDMAELCQLIAVTALLSFAALLLYRIRRTEAAGNAVAFGRAEGIAKLMLSIPSAMFAALIAYSFFDSPVWEIIFILLFGVLSCIIMEFIFRWDIRQVLSHKVHIIITVAAVAVIYFALRYDVTGYNTYLPKQDKIQSMSVNGGDFGFTYELEGINNMTSTGLLDYLEVEDFAPIYRMAENGAENAAKYYDYWNNEYEYADFKYHLKDGREIYRRYRIDSGLYLDCMDELQKNKEFRDKYYPMLTWDDTSHLDSISCSMTQEWVDELGLDVATEARSSSEVPGNTELAEGTDYELAESTGYELAEEEASWEVFVQAQGEEMERILEAYKKDLETVSYSDLLSYEYSLHVNDKERNLEFWPLSSKCTNTMEVIREIYEEHNS